MAIAIVGVRYDISGSSLDGICISILVSSFIEIG